MSRYHCVYVMESEKDGDLYVGYTRDVEKRVKEHNKGEVWSTKGRLPMKLIYWEGCINRQDATRREKYLKTAWGKRYIKERVRNYE